MTAPRDGLGVAITTLEAAAEGTQDAFDDWELGDRTLDRTVKSADRKCVDWDADHPGQKTKELLFGGLTTGQVVNAARADEPDLVARMVERGRDLPEGHPARPLLAQLTEGATASRTAHRAWVDAAQREAVAATAVEVAKLQVVAVHNDNQIDIERACGRTVAEACFPVLRRSSRAVREDEPTPPTD